MDLYQILEENDLVWTRQEMLAAFLILALASLSSYILCKKGKIKPIQAFCAVAMVFFLLLVFTSTVLGRNSGRRRYNLTLFWSYGVIAKGNKEILKEVLLNIILLFPAGVLLPLVFNRPLRWEYGLVFGAVISTVVELLQLITCRGLFEFDDIFHNSLGCMIGCVLCSKLLSKIKRK